MNEEYDGPPGCTGFVYEKADYCYDSVSMSPTVQPTTPRPTVPTIEPTGNPLSVINSNFAEPTAEPTGNQPTTEPTAEPIDASSVDVINSNSHQVFDPDFLIAIYVSVIGTACIFAAIGWIDAKYIRINDYFVIGCIFKALIGFLDFLSDLLFAIQLTMIEDSDDAVSLRITVFTAAGYFFIALPMGFSLGQLMSENKNEWVKLVDVRNWMKEKSFHVYILAVFSGSAFNAIPLVNCQALQLEIFSMGLTRSQRVKFSTHRIWGVVVCEVECTEISNVFGISSFQSFKSLCFYCSLYICTLECPSSFDPDLVYQGVWH